MSAASTHTESRRLPRSLIVLHWVIIVVFVVQLVYTAYQLFVVFAPPDGGIGPLLDAGKDVDADNVLIRRGYGAEFWMTAAGLVVYLALTEYLPRLLGYRGVTQGKRERADG